MKNKIYSFYCIVVFIALICFACSSKYSKENHRVTFILNDSLYVEKYKVFSGGATTSDSYSYYITDSIQFRKYVVTKHYDDERIIWTKTDSTITVYKERSHYHFYENENSITYDTIQIGNYMIEYLVKEGKFE
jgi:hypothetical protein